MSYNPLKPDAGPSPKDDVSTIKTNFSTFSTIFSQNHSAINNTNRGDHEAIILENQTQDPGVTENLDVLYNKNAPSNAGSQPQLWMQIPKFLPKTPDWTANPNFPMQLTYNSVGLTGPVYYSFLGGEQLYLIYFGTDTGMTAPNTVIADLITLTPAPTNILLAIATPNNLTTVGTPIPFSVATQVNSSSTFTIYSTGNASGAPVSYSFGWVAIAIP